MKYKTIVHIFLLSHIIIYSGCNPKQIPDELIGTWKSGEKNVRIRTEPVKGQYKFTTGKAVYLLHVKEDFSVDGSIGLATFRNKMLEIDRDPIIKEQGGEAFIIRCGIIGKIFDNDPLENKEVYLSLSLVDGIFAAGLYKKGQKLPLGGMTFSRVED